jgi:hypothetical protein
MQVVQTHLTQSTPTGTSHLIAWLPVNPKVKPGVLVDLDKDPDDRWKVEEQFMVTSAENIQRGWGLELPKSQRTER